MTGSTASPAWCRAAAEALEEQFGAAGAGAGHDLGHVQSGGKWLLVWHAAWPGAHSLGGVLSAGERGHVRRRHELHLAELTDRAVIEVSGEDRVAFLQGLVSNDVAAAAPGQRCGRRC